MNYESTFAGILYSKLQAENVEILNGAVISYSPKLYYLKTKYLISTGLKINHVILLPDTSDAQDEIVYRDWLPDQHLSIPQIISSFLRSNSLVYRTVVYPSIKRIGHFFPSHGADGQKKDARFWKSERDYYNDRDKWDFDSDAYESWGREGIALQDAHVKNLNKLCKDNGITLSLAIYPWPGQLIRRGQVSRYGEMWRTFADKNDVELIDMMTIFDDEKEPQASVKKYYIEGDSHFNAEGHGKIADFLEQWIKRHVFSKIHKD